MVDTLLACSRTSCIGGDDQGVPLLRCTTWAVEGRPDVESWLEDAASAQQVRAGVLDGLRPNGSKSSTVRWPLMPCWTNAQSCRSDGPEKSAFVMEWPGVDKNCD